MPRTNHSLPEGFILEPDFLTTHEEQELIAFIRALDFGAVRMHGVTAKRRVAQFGWHYSFESYRITPAAAMPAALEQVRERAAALAQIEPASFAEVLITEYPSGAGIGWHRDAPPFGIVAGVSLGSACRMRFQKGKGPERATTAVELPPRSIYLLTGSARNAWQHMIPPVREVRWSITLRTLRREPKVVSAPPSPSA